MVVKRIIHPERLRRVPKQFSWVDQRLVREDCIRGISHGSLSLYLFLVTVSDADGLSYYSDASLGHYLSLDPFMAQQARAELSTAGLIAYSRPLYQVLSLDKPQRTVTTQPAGRALSPDRGALVSVGEILRQAIGGK